MHAKIQLRREHGISEAAPIEHVLTVPAIWSAEACRKMQKAMATAIKQANFGTVENLFLVSEPEAAATYVLSQYNAVNVCNAWYPPYLNQTADPMFPNTAWRSLSNSRRWGWNCGRYYL
jgi:hypothetical protein